MKGFEDNIESPYFEVTGDEIVVSDPCYDEDVWCRHTVKDVLPGNWNADFTRAPCGFSSNDHRNAEIRAWHTDKWEEASKGTWELESHQIGVDSGQAGFFDKAHYKDEKVVPEEWKKDFRICEDDPWYAMNCHKTINFPGMGFVPYGVVSSSGIGDGQYNLYSKKVDGKVIALKLVFLGKYDYDETEDDEDSDGED